MAKITLTDGTIFEGTTGEIFAITERFNGVKAEAEALKVGDYAKVIDGDGNFELGTIAKVIEVDCTSVPYNLETLTGYNDWAKAKRVVKATDEEVTEAKAKVQALAEQSAKEAIFTQAGRKPNEYRKGDIVRADKSLSNSLDGNVGVVEDVTHNAIGVRFYNGGKYSAVFFNDGGKATLIATVESRLDRK